MAEKQYPAGDAREMLNLLENCPPEFVLGKEVGLGRGKVTVTPYRNYEIDFRAVRRGVAELAAKDPVFKHLSMAGEPAVESEGEGAASKPKKKKKTDEAPAS